MIRSLPMAAGQWTEVSRSALPANFEVGWSAMETLAAARAHDRNIICRQVRGRSHTIYDIAWLMRTAASLGDTPSLTGSTKFIASMNPQSSPGWCAEGPWLSAGDRGQKKTI